GFLSILKKVLPKVMAHMK
uniref:Melectin n=1 Tax=Melecta albifrons TaxID=582867 RepID=MEP_MELAF|nr:RecName: Full=Melectin; Short=MEP [Melecta albifrons]